MVTIRKSETNLALQSLSETRIRLSGFLDPFIMGHHPNLAVKILQFYSKGIKIKMIFQGKKRKIDIHLGLRPDLIALKKCTERKPIYF